MVSIHLLTAFSWGVLASILVILRVCRLYLQSGRSRATARAGVSQLPSYIIIHIMLSDGAQYIICILHSSLINLLLYHLIHLHTCASQTHRVSRQGV
jgi:hypothetical protein